MDTHLKVWDIRRKGCIQTYTGHTQGVAHVKFSPDGRWVVSGGSEGALKVWDITAGKLLHDLLLKGPAIQSLEFHPREFLMAAGDGDGFVSLWDLETFEILDRPVRDASSTGPVASVSFGPGAHSVLAAYQDSLCVWAWDPALTCLDSMSADWNGVADAMIAKQDQLIACTRRGEQVGTWMVNLQKLNLGAPNGDASVRPKAHKPFDTTHQSDFKVNSVLSAMQISDNDVDSDNPTDEDVPKAVQLSTPVQTSHRTPPPPSTQPHAPPTIQTPTHTPAQTPTPTPTQTPTPQLSTPTAKPKPKHLKPANSGHAKRDFGIDITPFLQNSAASHAFSGEVQEEDVMAHVSDHHNSVGQILGTRLTRFKKAKTSWTENGSGADGKGLLGVVGTLVSLDDASVTVEVLRLLPAREDYLTLDLCTALLPLMIDLFNREHDDYLLQALAWTSRLVKAFGHVIKSTREAPLAKGVDISKEERLEKCQTCHGNLVTVQHLLVPLLRRSGVVGSNAKDLAGLLKNFIPEN